MAAKVIPTLFEFFERLTELLEKSPICPIGIVSFPLYTKNRPYFIISHSGDMQIGKAHIIIRKHQDATMKNNKYFLLLIISILALSAIRCSAADAPAGDAEPLTAGLNEISGTVRILNPTAGELVDASNGSQIESGDQVVTDVDSRVRVDISDGSIIRVGPLSSFTLTDIGNEDGKLKGSFQLDVGSLWIILKGGEVKVDTPSGLASVRGSYLYIFVHPGEKNTFVTCLEGECELVNSVGKVKMVAGQTAKVINSKTDPELGQMSAEDVANWLKFNPEATEVIIPLTKTVEASKQNQGKGNGNDKDDKDKDKDNDDDDDVVVATATSTMTPSPTNTPTAIDCGPPVGWILHTVVNGEDIFTLAKAFQVEVSAIQKANCMSDSTSTVPGIGLYMPDVATITPTPTNTKTPTKTPVPPTKTNTPVPATATFTNTPVPTNSASVITINWTYSPADGKDISTCFNTYKAQVIDADGIASVKLLYTVVGGTSGSATLTDIGSDIYEIANHHIITDGASTDTVKWSIEVKDSKSNVETSATYVYTDGMDCGKTTTFSSESHPTTGTSLTTTGECPNLYSIYATDPDGLTDVKIEYSVDSFNTTYYQVLAITGGDKYSGTWSASTLSLDTTVITPTVTPPIAIEWRYKAIDDSGDVVYYSGGGSSFTIDDQVGCGP